MCRQQSQVNIQEFAPKIQIYCTQARITSGNHLRVIVTYFSQNQKGGQMQLTAV